MKYAKEIIITFVISFLIFIESISKIAIFLPMERVIVVYCLLLFIWSKVKKYSGEFFYYQTIIFFVIILGLDLIQETTLVEYFSIFLFYFLFLGLIIDVL